MAVVEMIQSHYSSPAAIKKVIDYVLDVQKTLPDLQGGIFCTPQLAVTEFKLTKAMYHKEKGRQIIHLTQSFSPTDNVTPELVKEIAQKFLTHPSFAGYQIVYAVHTNKAHLHSHFVINTVSYATGRKWQQTKEDLASLKAFSDTLCQAYGLSVIEKGKKRRESRRAYRARKKNRSYFYEATLAFKTALAHADSKDKFFANMKALGYKVDWFGSKEIMIITPTGQRVYAKSVYPKGEYTKEKLEQFLADNRLTAADNIDFERLLNRLGKLEDQLDEGVLPLSYLKEQEMRKVEQIEMILLTSEFFLDLVMGGEENYSDSQEAWKRCCSNHSLTAIKDYLAEKKKGQGLYEPERVR